MRRGFTRRAGGPGSGRAARRRPAAGQPRVAPLVRLVMAGLVALTAASAVVVAAPAQPAYAAGYRYWSFWLGNSGRWTYAQAGPALTVPDDGAVEGWRFTVSADSDAAARPRAAADFSTVCGATPSKAGTKRVALVLDFGTAADAADGGSPPPGRSACAQVGTDATGADVLAAVARPLRYNSAGMVCAITGYPVTGCGEQVAGDRPAAPATAAPTAAARGGGDRTGSTSLSVSAGLAAVLTLGGAAWWQARRRRSS